MVGRVGLEPTMCNNGLKARAVRRYGNRPISCSTASSMGYIVLHNVKWNVQCSGSKSRT